MALGAYDQCLKFSRNITSNQKFKGQYCNVVFPIKISGNEKKLSIKPKASKEQLDELLA